jgi:hypothetical protein
MISEEKILKIKEIFKNSLYFATAEDIATVSNFYWTTNYYLLLREDNLRLVFKKVIDSEVLNSLIFNTMPSILFLFSDNELTELIKDISKSFIFWNEKNTHEVATTADVVRIEETRYDSAYLQTKLNNEKWIIILCLFFLYFPAIEVIDSFKALKNRK